MGDENLPSPQKIEYLQLSVFKSIQAAQKTNEPPSLQNAEESKNFSSTRAAERGTLLSCAYGLIACQLLLIFQRAIEAAK
ncbi:hypothetical protein [Eubacterium sp. 1001713B170207_170306_E7]|uniref:hypothetical protein n=1 Tax=Eubacterium sp. 1001713B170207_170306_E7 TaxID=2787097 RepID=UPI001A9B7190|nr:hypothetical protein [Eubacterium sp. 1001713B170207_170306_E7]